MSSKAAHQSIRLFKNPLLEALTHVHPSLPFIVWVPVVIYFFVVSRTEAALGYSAIALFSALGFAFWTLTEYAMHRFVFHYDASTRVGKYLVFLFHGIHHDDPQDPSRLVMPPAVSIPLGIAFFYLFKTVMAERALPFFAAFIAGYLVYDYLHFAVHHFRPKSQWAKTLKENHMKHHFIAHGAKWGVSTPVWDHVFRTFE